MASIIQTYVDCLNCKTPENTLVSQIKGLFCWL
jgi:translation initiation factor 2 beta subunit (eIF-2beta)/eIF-5